MTNPVDTPIADSPEPLTYPTGAVVEFVVTGFNIRDITNGQLVNLVLKPNEILEWPDDVEEPNNITELPIMRRTEFLMNNQPSAQRELANKLQTYTGVSWEGLTTRQHLDAIRGHALTLAVTEGPTERGDYKTTYRHNL